MTDAVCMPLRTLEPIAESDERPDRFVELLECVAELLVETRRQREDIQEHSRSDDPRLPEAIALMTEVEQSIREMGVEAASVHQLLQHMRLI
jgi:hypothetical protein